MSDRRRPRRPKYNSLVAAAELMVAPNRALSGQVTKTEAWQADAWRYYDTVGELRFGVSWIANAMSRVNLVAAAPPSGSGDEPTIISQEEEGFTPAQYRAAEIVETISGGSAGQGQMLAAFGIHLSVTGIGWLVAEPDMADPEADAFETWHVYSSDEIRMGTDGIEIAVASRVWRPVHPNAIVIKVWRPHPRRSWEPDAPTHGVLNVLREIDLLQKHIQASAQSRLAGAGLLAIPSEAVFPPGQGPQTSVEDIDPEDQNTRPPDDTFVETLIDAMTTPIADRGSAAAVVPLVVKIPGEYVDKVKHISFSTPFDSNVLSLMESAITRLSLGMDIPPEILTGKGATNHWSAWQVQEESIVLHIEPLSETICHALTIGYLKAALEAEGYDPDEAMVWYDTSDLRTRPDRSKGAIEAYDRNELSSAALLRELGLSADDLPSEEEKRERILLNILRGAPSLAPIYLEWLGYIPPAVAEDVIAVDAGEEVNVEDTPPEAPATQGPPDTQPESVSAALVAACDIVVRRALEKAGTRLKSAAGKNVKGGAAAIPCDNPLTLHTKLPASQYSDPTHLLQGAWTFVPEIANRYGFDSVLLAMSLQEYTLDLLDRGIEHDYERLERILAPSATV